jgi:hypothetical protein
VLPDWWRGEPTDGSRRAPGSEKTMTSLRFPGRADRSASVASDGPAVVRPEGWPEGVPGPADLLMAAPAVARLCARYHELHLRMIERGRWQRIGIALVVAAVGVGSFLLGKDAGISAVTVTRSVSAVALAAVVSLGVLGVLWTRDTRRRVAQQGERLLRAVSIAGDLSPDQVAATARSGRSSDIFLACYATWRSQGSPPTPVRPAQPQRLVSGL